MTYLQINEGFCGFDRYVIIFSITLFVFIFVNLVVSFLRLTVLEVWVLKMKKVPLPPLPPIRWNVYCVDTGHYPIAKPINLYRKLDIDKSTSINYLNVDWKSPIICTEVLDSVLFTYLVMEVEIGLIVCLVSDLILDQYLTLDAVLVFQQPHYTCIKWSKLLEIFFQIYNCL